MFFILLLLIINKKNYKILFPKINTKTIKYHSVMLSRIARQTTKLLA